jgi:putative CocE/NonD family hydrolase
VSDSMTVPPADARNELYDVKVVRDVRIPTAEPGITLSADLFLPDKDSQVPALVTVLPYRKDAAAGIIGWPLHRWFASRGYACLLVDFRGTGSSDGEQRPPFDPSEADDGVDAVEWAAAQAWCDGNVGMWGHSYGAIMSMRTAGRRPPHLKAILPVMGMLDPERDFVHPAGKRGMNSLASWGMHTLLNQLLPPLYQYGTADEQRRWRNRLHHTEPYLLDLVRHGPNAPVWRSRVVDASPIAIPTFCVGGWRDLFCDGTVRAYEQIDAPKKLLVGPWMHTMPHNSPFHPIDFHTLALRWWDQWLSGIDTGLMDERPVTLYVQGEPPQWFQFTSWPPSKSEMQWATAGNTTLTPRTSKTDPEVQAEHDDVVGECESDPTVGALSGLSGAPTSGFGLPLDQHDDDMRSLSATSAPLSADIVVSGRPAATVRLATGSSEDRIIVRLVDVDPRGRSTLITDGVASSPPGKPKTVSLTPTCYRIRAGHRLRLIVSDADFPRLWPAVRSGDNGHILRLTGADLTLPIMSEADGVEISLAQPDRIASEPQFLGQQPHWSITRDLINDGIEVALGEGLADHTPGQEHALEVVRSTSAKVRRDSPEGARLHGKATATARMGTGETIVIRLELHMNQTTVVATGQVSIDGTTIFSHRWDALTDGNDPDRPVASMNGNQCPKDATPEHRHRRTR